MKKGMEFRPKKRTRMWIVVLAVTFVAILFHFALQSGFFVKVFSVLEPIIIVLLAVIVCGILLAVYLPMFTMYGGMGV